MPDPWSPTEKELRSIISKSLDADRLFEEARKIFSDQTAPAFLNLLYELQGEIVLHHRFNKSRSEPKKLRSLSQKSKPMLGNYPKTRQSQTIS